MKSPNETKASEILRLAISEDCPVKEGDLTVFDTLVMDSNGYEFTFDIIGSSHYIHSEDAGYYELFSCDPIDWPDTCGSEGVYRIRMDSGTEDFIFAQTGSGANVTAAVEPLGAYDFNQDRTFEYAFGQEAITSIDITSEGGITKYETYHTYPEYDEVVCTQTKFCDEFCAE